ncbi:MAG: ATP-binding protein [Acidimicrobiales bacterium]
MTVDVPVTGALPARFTRSRDDRWVAGVCGGLARAVGLDALAVRVIFAVLTVAGGLGAAAYVAAWLLVRREGDEQSLAEAAVRGRRWNLVQVLSAGCLALGVLLLVRATGFWLGDTVVWPVLLAAAGLGVIWRQAGDDDRPSLAQVVGRLPHAGSGTAPDDVRSRRAALVRVAVGAVLVASGVGGFLAATDSFSAVRQGLVASAGIVTGLALITGPWWLRLGKDLAHERRRRIRSEERAEVAAHVHDSVLQTLALIQRNAGDPRAVVTMARRQERELRGWLWADGRDAPEGDTLAAEVARVAEEVETLHSVALEVVAVGDCPLDDGLAALVAAAREAMVNAAVWSGSPTVSVFTEASDDEVTAYVRDWGKGFDPGKVAPDRHGLRESITGRMARNGGTAVVRSTVGEGTEVQLRIRKEHR